MPGELVETARAVGEAFTTAEAQVALDLAAFHQPHEETITTLLHLRVHERLKTPDQQQRIQEAFERDLSAAFPMAAAGATTAVADRIVAEVVWHPRSVEAKTGGDFAL